MVQVVILVGKPPDVAKADAVVLQTQRADGVGWAKLAPGMWIVETEAISAVWRDHLKERTSGIQIFVARLNGNWATSGFTDQAAWLKERRGLF